MKYLAMLSVLFFVGCASMCEKGSTTAGHGSYRDYNYTEQSGTTMVHRVYTNGHQEWITLDEATQSPAK